MSVDVTVTRKGLFKKEVTLQDITGESLAYGVMDEGFRLIPNEQGEHTVIYDPKCIGRGIGVSFKNDSTALRLNVPSSPREIKLFYQLVENICKMLNTNHFDRDGEKTALSKIESLIESDMKFAKVMLAHISNEIEKEAPNVQCIQIFGARIPLSIGPAEVRRINGSLEEYENWLNEKQQFDAYYASPRVFKNDAGLFGVYVIGADIVSIVPTTPKLVMSELEEIPNWYVVIGDDCRMVFYADFIANVKDTEFFDSEHVAVKLSGDEIQELLSKYEVKI